MPSTSASKHVVLTGATRGLGRALVAPLVSLGHVVSGCGRSRTQVAELTRAYHLPHGFDVVDVTDDHLVRDWAKLVLARQGPPDLLINNAAVIARNAPLWEVPVAEFDGVIDVNVKGVANVIRHFVPAMIAAKHGIIVNLSSGWGRSTSGEVAAYCASKWAIEGLTKALAQELPDGMAAVPVNPGIIDTDMLRSCFGTSAGDHAKPSAWAVTAVPFLLRLGPKDNGKSLTMPS